MIHDPHLADELDRLADTLKVPSVANIAYVRADLLLMAANLRGTAT